MGLKKPKYKIGDQVVINAWHGGYDVWLVKGISFIVEINESLAAKKLGWNYYLANDKWAAESEVLYSLN